MVTLAKRGWTVAALARSGADLAALAEQCDGAVQPVAVDYADVERLRSALPGQFDAALVYAPQASAAVSALLRSAVSGPLIELVTSAAAEPAADEPFDFAALAGDARDRWTVLLGWRADRTWHSPAEISAAALRALDERRNVVLGLVRPWSDRPI